MIDIELSKDKFGETITVTEGGHSKSFAERNYTERTDFYHYREMLGDKQCVTV